MNRPNATPSDWRKAWPDALAFVVGLGVAWRACWNTTDLIWSLWLSSLLVGLVIGFWAIFRSAWGHIGEMIFGVLTFICFVGCFGGMHVFLSMALNDFFPFPGLIPFGGEGYFRVFKEYWIWLPVALLAERAAFRLPPPRVDSVSVKAKDIDARFERHPVTLMLKPCLNAARMHVVILFLAFAYQKKLESFVVYSVVYAAYFFPWSLIFRPSAGEIEVAKAQEHKSA